MCTAEIKTKLNQSAYDAMRKKSTIVLNLLKEEDIPDDFKGEKAWEFPHPLHKERVDQYTKTLLETKTKKYDTISVGDSLMDGWTKEEFTAVHKSRNFNIGGSWAHHMRDMYKAMIPIMLVNNIRADNIIIGSLGGNPFLMRQHLDLTVKHSIAVLDDLRKMLPIQRIIVYGIPPTVSAYATGVSPAFEAALYKWVLKDINSVFLPLQKKFAKWMIFPKAVMSADGVHFTPLGIKEFDELLVRAKTAKPRSIVD